MPRNSYQDENDGPTPEGDLVTGVGFVGKIALIGVIGFFLTWFLAMLPALGPFAKAFEGLGFMLGVGIIVIFIVGGVAWLALKILTWPLRLFFRHRYRSSRASSYR